MALLLYSTSSEVTSNPLQHRSHLPIFICVKVYTTHYTCSMTSGWCFTLTSTFINFCWNAETRHYSAHVNTDLSHLVHLVLYAVLRSSSTASIAIGYYFLTELQASHASWKVLDFFLKISGPGKSWKKFPW